MIVPESVRRHQARSEDDLLDNNLNCCGARGRRSDVEENLENESKNTGKPSPQDGSNHYPQSDQESNSLEALEGKLIEQDKVNYRHDDSESNGSEQCGQESFDISHCL